MRDENLLSYATTRQAEVLKALWEHGTQRKAAAALGVDKAYVGRIEGVVAKRAARMGYAPGNFESGVAPGYAMGKVTVQRNAQGGVERTWERQSPDAEALQQYYDAIRETLREEATPLPPVSAPDYADGNLLTVIPLGDPHFGMFAWEKETGENFDLDIAEKRTFETVDRIVARSPASGTAMLLNLGDFFHANDGTNKTQRSGALLDVDGRYTKIAMVGYRAMERCILRLLEKHKHVIVRNNKGNHDPEAFCILTVSLMARFHDNPRVTVEATPSPFYYYRWGNTLIGSTHGDGAKLVDLPMIMANDRKHDWAQSIWRVWHVGHFHHNQKIVQKDLVGCEVETHRTLAATDAWHHHSGYRSYKDLKGIVYDKEMGEVMRFRAGVEHLDCVD